MRYALIDNSTLTGIQRLLGHIPIKNTLVVDMDILCLESLLEAILFYDEIFVIDDYKSEFRESRKQSFPFLTFLPAEVLPLPELIAQTKNFTESIVPRVEGGQFTDQNFQPFFNLLRMNVTFTWDMTSSIYFLTQKMLAGMGGVDLQKYSQLSTAIYDELVDRNRAAEKNIDENKIVLVDSRGNLIDNNYEVFDSEGRASVPQLSRQAQAFFAGLNWLAFRTIFYTVTARSFELDLFLHPIRHAFQANFIPKLFKGDTDVFRPLLDAMNDVANNSINKILADTQPFVTKQTIPIFVTWLATRTHDPERFLEVAFELRNEKPLVEARKRLIDLESTVAQGTFTAAGNKLLHEVESAMESIVSKYSANTAQGVSLSSFIALWNLSTTLSGLPKLPDSKVRVPQLEFIKHVLPANGFKALYRSLVSDLVQISRLGKYHEIITSKINLDADSSAFLAKQEQAIFRRAKSGWKIPM